MAAKRCFVLSGMKGQKAPLARIKGLGLTEAESKLISETLGLPAEEEVCVLNVTPIGRPCSTYSPQQAVQHLSVRGHPFTRVNCLAEVDWQLWNLSYGTDANASKGSDELSGWPRTGNEAYHRAPQTRWPPASLP